MKPDKSAQKEILGDLAFTPRRALYTVLFGLCCGAVGLGAFTLCAGHAFIKSEAEVKARLLDTLNSAALLYEGGQTPESADAVLERRPLNLVPQYAVGPQDLALTSSPELERVKGQKLKFTENLYAVRFVALPAPKDKAAEAAAPKKQ